MNTNVLCLALICLTLLTAHYAHAGDPGLRCGSHLITDGMHIEEVRILCGEPTSERVIGYVPHAHRGYHPDLIVVEFVYDRGNRKLIRILRFEGDRLVSIDTAGYGHR